MNAKLHRPQKLRILKTCVHLNMDMIYINDGNPLMKLPAYGFSEMTGPMLERTL